MPVGSIECPPCACLPRDSNHECRVCRVTVVGLTAYAKHISSQLHKEQTDAYDRAQEGNEDAEEEYFDQELIQLINQKKEQSSRPDDESNTPHEPETDDRRLHHKREERGPHGDRNGFDQVGWHHHSMPHRDWQWEKERFANSRRGNFPHSTRNPNIPNSRYPSGPKGRASWHLNNCGNPAKRHHMIGNSGAAWHANAGSSATWNHPGTGRNRNWNPESSTGFPTRHPGNSGGNWKSAPRGSNCWSDGFLQSRDRFDNMPLGWNTKRGRSVNYNQMRYPWDQQDYTGTPTPYGDPAEEQSEAPLMDFTNDKLARESLFNFNLQERAEPKMTKCSVKVANPSKEKLHRWSPYPSQKASDSQPATDNDAPESLEEDPSLLPFQSPKQILKGKVNNLGTFPKQNVNADEIYRVKNDTLITNSSSNQESTSTAGVSNLGQEPNKSSTMPSIKLPLLPTPDKKLSVQKCDAAYAPSNHKNVFPLSPREGRSRLNALNLETDHPNSYISKLRSASCRGGKCIKDIVDISTKEPVESLSEVLRKAKEILECSQSMRSQHFLRDSKDLSVEATNADLPKTGESATEIHMEFLENVSDGELSDFDGSEARSEKHGFVDDISTNSITPHVDIGKKDSRNIGESAKLSSISIQIESCSSPIDNAYPSALENEDREYLQKSDAQDDSEGAKNSVGHQDLKESSQQSLLPELSKLGLPVSLQRDLTRHIGPKCKAGAHLPEPNLNIARRIRNLSGHRKSETDKESGLKPTLRQILNASRRNVNWEQVIQHVSKKKQELGKGLPRFGIEMVAPVVNDQEGLDWEEGHDLASFERFHWEGMMPLGSARKRSLSESSVVVDRTAAIYDFFSNQPAERESEQRQSIPTSLPCRVALGPNSTVEKKESGDLSSSFTSEKQPACLRSGRRHSSLSPIHTTSFLKREDFIPRLDNQKTTENPEDEHSLGQNKDNSLPTSNIIDLATDSSCTSGTEQNDNHNVGKKRRATADGSSPEMTSLEQKRKRRKIKAKKERSQVDKLLTISLREEELSSSLQSLDSNLLHARAALQAAYVEVQRLMVLKQQITMEMSTMRTQRIQILQGLQETLEYPDHIDQPQESVRGERIIKLKDSPALTADASPSNHFSLFLDTPTYISPHASSPGAVFGTPLRVRTPPTFQTPSRLSNSAPDASGSIKQELISKPGGKMDTPLHVSPLLPQSGPTLATGKIIQNPSSTLAGTSSLSSITKRFPSVPEESGMDKCRPTLVENKSQESSENSKLEGNRSMLEGASFEKRTSVFESTTLNRDASMENKNICPIEMPEQQAQSTMAFVEGKKKKKLRKKKTLRASNVPDNSDTEMDICCDSVRKVKTKRVPREGKVTTSTSCEIEEGSTALAMQSNKDENDSDSTVEVVEIANPIFEVLDIDSECGEGKPDSPSKRDSLTSTEKRLLEVTRSGYDEVSSTSEMGANYRNGILRSTAETQTSISSVRSSKNNSDVSSEPGEEDDPTEGSFEGHKAAVNAIQIFGGLLYTCSADKTVRAYSLVSRKCVAIFEGHTSKVNCLLLTLTTGKKSALFTGSNDHTIRCYNTKTRECTDRFQLEDRVVCLHTRWRILFAGLANGSVITFAIKNGKKLDSFECHGPRAVSCLASAQEGARRLLLVGSYDCTITVRDAQNGLLLRTLEGHSKTVLCMKVVNDLVFSGSSDQSVHAHNIHTGELVRIYKGHNHAVTVVNILGKVMVTASLDKFVRVYELQSHDRLQVYGGHTDMIMCMAIHKSMIYTGCYDGSIQGVRLNLMQNYRCWWHGCSLIFGVVDHLKQHLLTDHTNPNFHTLKCRWKNCDAFFTAKRGSKQDAPGHIERHAEDDSKIDT